MAGHDLLGKGLRRPTGGVVYSCAEEGEVEVGVGGLLGKLLVGGQGEGRGGYWIMVLPAWLASRGKYGTPLRAARAVIVMGRI